MFVSPKLVVEEGNKHKTTNANVMLAPAPVILTAFPLTVLWLGSGSLAAFQLYRFSGPRGENRKYTSTASPDTSGFRPPSLGASPRIPIPRRLLLPAHRPGMPWDALGCLGMASDRLKVPPNGTAKAMLPLAPNQLASGRLRSVSDRALRAQ